MPIALPVERDRAEEESRCPVQNLRTIASSSLRSASEAARNYPSPSISSFQGFLAPRKADSSRFFLRPQTVLSVFGSRPLSRSLPSLLLLLVYTKSRIPSGYLRLKRQIRYRGCSRMKRHPEKRRKIEGWIPGPEDDWLRENIKEWNIIICKRLRFRARVLFKRGVSALNSLVTRGSPFCLTVLFSLVRTNFLIFQFELSSGDSFPLRESLLPLIG